MARLLHIHASPRAWQSYSFRVASAFLEAFQSHHPGVSVETLNLFAAGVPEFTDPAAAAKYAVMEGQEPQDEAEQAWEKVVELIRDFASADAYVISTPMWNFSIPYKLKQYVDNLVQPGLTFSYNVTDGYQGMLLNKSALLILARGGEYPVGSAAAGMDMQKPYLEMVLRFIGVTNICSLTVESTLSSPDVAERNLQAALAQAKELGAQWPALA